MNLHDRLVFPRTSLDVNRDNFEKSFFTSVRKAINPTECPVKEKHIRRIVIGTFITKSGQIFWSYARRLPLDAHQIVCWKFCHVLHKVLRDGHPKVIPDSYRYRQWLLELCKMWGLLKQGYGKLIHSYCSLLVNKIDFHIRNPRFPGNLIITDGDLDRIGENDVNIFFQLCCEIYDYMDEILCLQNNVYLSLDTSYSSSMTSTGQCRIAPIIMCIQDSSQLYDFTVKILFKLHKALPHSTLEGHRERFLNQFKLLKTFYSNYSRLQYFQHLITIPKLPEEPPNFFVQSNLNSHVTPIVVIPEQQQDDGETNEDNLLDLTFDTDSDKVNDAIAGWSFQDDESNKVIVEERSLIEEKDRIIERFSNRIGELEIELQQNKFELEKRIEDYKRQIAELECAAAQRMEREVEQLKMEMERQKSSVVEEQATKFTKMKEFYNKFRAEHIELLKAKAENDRQLAVTLRSLEQLKKENETLSKQLDENCHKDVQMDSFVQLNNELKGQLSFVQQQYEKIAKEFETLKIEKNDIDNRYELTKQKLEHSNYVDEINKKFIATLLNESTKISERLIDEEMDLGLLSVNCSPQYFSTQIQILITRFGDYEHSIQSKSYSINLFQMAFHYYYQLFYMINCSKTTIRSLSNIDLSNELSENCVHLVQLNNEFVQTILNNFHNTNDGIEKIRQCLQKIYELTLKVLPELAINQKNLDLESLLNKEMTEMDQAIQLAVSKIEQMLTESNVQQTGLKLEVNGKILTACTALMQAIRQLILDSKRLQLEIASKQKGNFSIKEFYQRNHRWTEGLISAAKTVAADANLLVETADKIISGSGKFEALMAASQEIAASCAQLVVASRVKAEASSQNLSNLSKSSKSVLKETGNIIAITKHCSKLIEENVETDISKLSLHQAKRLEMECQVKVLELENALEKERVRLASIRRQHYHMAESLSNSDSN
uniref:Huntingtin-interacting protein 1-like n=1 Tax=Dermatophagoides pteronyssinus TaxID=6956 RepID=A0A6P6YF67_DERPT|nr:huntingtin-interacting protein 1-like [Dermatophagoides pteronyssinus]